MSTNDLSRPTIVRTAQAGPDRDGAARADAAVLDEQRRKAAARLAASLKMAEVSPDADEPDEAPADEDAVFELKASAIGDIDEAGGRMVVTLDRVVLRDADGWERGAVPIAEIERVEVKRRFSATSIRIKGCESTIKLKGVRQTRTVGLRAAIAELRFADDPNAPAATTAEALRRLDEQAQLGLLTEAELAVRRSAVTRGTKPSGS
jgi:hypothetical protein